MLRANRHRHRTCAMGIAASPRRALPVRRPPGSSPRCLPWTHRRCRSFGHWSSTSPDCRSKWRHRSSWRDWKAPERVRSPCKAAPMPRHPSHLYRGNPGRPMRRGVSAQRWTTCRSPYRAAWRMWTPSLAGWRPRGYDAPNCSPRWGNQAWPLRRLLQRPMRTSSAR